MTPLDYTRIVNWMNFVFRIETLFTNAFEYPIEVYYDTENLSPKLLFTLEPQQTLPVSTTLGHIFFATKHMNDDSVSHPIVDFTSISDRANYTFHPSNHLEKCELTKYNEISFTDGKADCDDIEMRYIEFAHSKFYEKRLGLNFFQPQIVKAVTNEGFKKRQLPEGTFAWLREWYGKAQQEEESKEYRTGSTMNQASSPSSVTHLPQDEKNRLAAELKVLKEFVERCFNKIYLVAYTRGLVRRRTVHDLYLRYS